MTDTRRRVKVYTLNEERQWDDKGTGHVSYVFDALEQSTTLIVRAEQGGSILLESKILQDTAYQKQQETLIVWSESDNTDLALSFQEKPGCDEIWENICQVQGKDPSVTITQDIADDEEDGPTDGGSDLGLGSNEPVELPPCELSQLEEIEHLFASCLQNLTRREKLAIAVETSGYIPKLLALFHMNEDLENTDGLHHLHEIFKTLFMLNKNSLFEVMLADENIMDIIGCLEYDPSTLERRRHREYLSRDAKFREVLPIKNENLRRKIHQTFKVQYIQDVILPTPSVFEENLLSMLNTFLFFGKVQIVNTIKDDESFMNTLFEQLKDESQADERRAELAGFLRELCVFSQTLQVDSREDFFKILDNVGLFPTVESLLCSDDAKLRHFGVDIFTHVVEYSPSMVRDYAHREMENSPGSDDEDLLINLVIEQMICDSDPELSGAVQLMNLLRLLLDPENMTPSKNEKTGFLSFFYHHCMHVLMAPLLAYTAEDKPRRGDYQTAQLLSLILELITFYVEHHTYHVKSYILNKDLLKRILVLINSRHLFLALATLRFVRKIISMKDELYNQYIVKGNLLQPVVDVLFRSGSRYNLLNSAVLELFEYIRSEDVKSLIAYVAEKHLPSLEKIDYVKTFSGIKLRYEQQKDRMSANKAESLGSNRFRRDERAMDEDEENWFDTEEEESDALMTFSSSEDADSLKVNIDKILESVETEDEVPKTNSGKAGTVAQSDNVASLSVGKKAIIANDDLWVKSTPGIVNGTAKADRDFIVENKEKQESTSPSVTVKTGLVGLVDYDESDDEENEPEGGDKGPKSRGETPSFDPKKATPDNQVTSDIEPPRKKAKLQTIGSEI